MNLRSPWAYAAAAGGFLAIAGATTLVKGSSRGSGQRAAERHRSWNFIMPGSAHSTGPMTFDQPISAREFRRLARAELGFSFPRGTQVWPTEAREHGGVRRTGQRDAAAPIWQDRNRRYQFFARGDQDFYLLDRMYSDRLTPEFSPDGRGIRWVGKSAEPVPLSVSAAALDLHKAQRAARGVERYRAGNPWREGRSGWGNRGRRAGRTAAQAFFRAYLEATRVTEISGWRRWPNGVNTRLEEDRELGGLRLAGLNAPPGARKAVLAVATQLSAWAHEFDVLYMTSESASTAIQMFLTDAEFREWYPDDYHSGRRTHLDALRTALTPFLRADGRHDAVYAYITTGRISADTAAVALLRKVAKQAMAWKTAADTRAAGRALLAKLDAG